MKLNDIFSSLNVKERCKVYRVGLWQCPHFLFIVLGFVIIVSIIVTHIVAQKYTDPDVEIMIVSVVTVALLIISHTIVDSFDRVAVASQLKSEFISIISHELRNPLSSIKWQTNILLDSKTQVLPETEKKALSIISEQNERMIRMINDLLDVNRIEDRALGLAGTLFSIADLTSRVIEEYTDYARASNIKLNFMSPKTDFKIKADEGRIHSVIARFVDNAIRYSSSAGEVAITLEDLGKNIRWSITDQGVGIPASDVRSIFSRFFRASNALRYQTEGLGIGLYMAKYVIEASRGKIGFRTIEGHGSTFFFTLPKA